MSNEMTTPYGIVQVDAQGSHTLRVYVERDDEPLRVNGVAYTLNGHAHRHADGSWHLRDEHERDDWHNPYPSRVGSFEDPTDAARRNLRAMVVDVAERFAAEHPDALVEAGDRARESAIREREAEVVALTRRIEALRAEVDALREPGARIVWRSNHHTSGHDDATKHVLRADGSIMPALAKLDRGIRHDGSPFEPDGHIREYRPAHYAPAQS